MSSTVIPKQGKGIDLPTFTIMIDGKDVSATYGFVSLSVSRAINRISVAKVVLNDGDISKREFERSDMDTFEPGKKVTIKAGYHKEEDVIFAGIIIKHGIDAPDEGTSSLVLEMRHEAVKMTIGRKNKTFTKKKDKDIISSIISAAGVTGSAEKGEIEVEHEDLVQYYTTDWNFIMMRAEANGLLAFLDDKGIKIKKPDFSTKPVFELHYGANIVRFRAEMDARDQLKKIKTVGWDYSKQETVKGKSQTSTSPSPEEGNLDGEKLSKTIGLDEYLMQHQGRTKKEELDAWATAKLMRSRLSKITGSVRIHGTSAVKPGDMVQLHGLGKKFEGNVFVSGVSNTYSLNNGWYTDIYFGLDQDWFTDTFEVTDKPASGLLAGMNGLRIGTVVKIDDADGGEFRVRVKLPEVDGSNEDVWARVAALDAGDSYGVVVRPKEGNEVVMGFINDDPRDAIILGVLHSKKNKTPADLEAKKADKFFGWFTKGKIKLYIDDEKKVVLVETPAKNTMIIDDDKKSITLMDQHKNKIIMDDKGILIETPKDLTMKATGDVKMEGKNITEKAQMQYKASGSSGAELSSSGQAVVKGSIVKIN